MEMAWLWRGYILGTVWELQGELSAVLCIAWALLSALHGHCTDTVLGTAWALHENCSQHCMGTAWALCGPSMGIVLDNI